MNEHLLSDRRGEVDTGPRKGTRHHWEDWKHTRECRTVVGKRELRYAQVSNETWYIGKRDLLLLAHVRVQNGGRQARAEVCASVSSFERDPM